jgi:4-diphosphocytidyl-2-C-methyl-D-erythritol kinase
MSQVEKALEMRAPAKVNLFLEVVGERTNGYHDIQSIVVPVSIFDRIVLEQTADVVETVIAPGSRVPVEELDLARPEDNLATRAALVLREKAGYAGGVRIHLTKNIPVGGGLGGGSSNAAAVLRGLNALWDLGLSLEELKTIGFALGCDVPALIQGGPVCMEGLGERVTPIPTEWVGVNGGSWLVVVNPGFSVQTGDIYDRYRSPLTSADVPYRSMVCAFREGNFETLSKGLYNGLQNTVFRKYPLTEIVVEELGKAGAAGALLSGSGASSFGLALNEEDARGIAQRVQKHLGSAVWTQAAKMLPDGVMVAHGPLEA